MVRLVLTCGAYFESPYNISTRLYTAHLGLSCSVVRRRECKCKMSVFLSDSLSTHKVSVLVVSFIVYLIYEVVYRLYMSPISEFPGPRLAAASFWYEFYYDIVLGGKYTWKIAELHEKYGIRYCFCYLEIESDRVRKGLLFASILMNYISTIPSFTINCMLAPQKERQTSGFGR